MLKGDFMKKMSLFMILGLLLALVSSSYVLAEQTEGYLDVKVQSYNPTPVEPGSRVNVIVKVTNEGSLPTKNSAVEFVDNYPFTLYQESDRKKIIGELGPGDYFLAEFDVRVDPDAVEGTNYLKIRLTNDVSKDSWVEKELPIDVRSVDKVVSINKVTVNPAQPLPGDEAEVTIRLKNTGNSDLRDVSLKLDLSNSELPFAPLNTASEQQLKTLRKGESADFEFTLKVFPDARVKVYKIPLVITYTDQSGSEHTRNDLLGLTVTDSPELLFRVEENQLRKEVATGKITLSVTNKGFDEIKFATLELEENDYFEIISPSRTEYLGNIDSDDYETASFDLRLKKPADVIEVPVKVEFKDSLNNDKVVSETLKLKIYDRESLGESKGSNTLFVLLVIVVIVVGAIIWRRRKRKKLSQE